MTCRIRHFFGQVTIDAFILPTCEAGETHNPNLPSGCQKHKGEGCTSCSGGQPSAGNPIAIHNGNKFEQVTDFETAGPDSLRFVRYYNSYAQVDQSLGFGWRSNYDRHLAFPSSQTTIVSRPDGEESVFTLTWRCLDAQSRCDRTSHDRRNDLDAD